jgi:Icc-related predicted phosphoesterase
MKIVAISDTHNQHDYLTKWDWLPPADVLVHGGDVSLQGKEYEVKAFFEWFFRLDQYKHKIFVAGNHDWLFERQPNLIKNTIFPPGVHYLNDSGVDIEGVKFWGSPIQPWFHNWAFNRDRGADIKKHWDLIPVDTDVLITHGPPYGILDEVLYESRFNPEKKVGCRDLTEKIKELTKLKAHIFGHIHEAYGEEIHEGVKYMNASFVTRGHEAINRPHLFEI